ncbi:hypothetical protein H6A12_04480 [Phocea massiliensis]|uniref:Uncharacterized protein n=1 Tax=Merdimmobilis hominis TaxID=2897707 RepID=A0A939BDV9_9FIRM|nr:hypothetical protein [Merdimmobilis hominis]MBM6920412.1 hypothetical protein [Merdimmobilis hominis]
MTLGQWMFYGGIVSFSVFCIALIIIKIVLASKGKRLKARFDAEYGPEK